MARVTVEDCLEHVQDRFELTHLIIKRVEQLRNGVSPTIDCDNKEIVTALREVAKGNIKHLPVDEYDSDEF